MSGVSLQKLIPLGARNETPLSCCANANRCAGSHPPLARRGPWAAARAFQRPKTASGAFPTLTGRRLAGRIARGRIAAGRGLRPSKVDQLEAGQLHAARVCKNIGSVAKALVIRCTATGGALVEPEPRPRSEVQGGGGPRLSVGLLGTSPPPPGAPVPQTANGSARDMR